MGGGGGGGRDKGKKPSQLNWQESRSKFEQIPRQRGVFLEQLNKKFRRNKYVAWALITVVLSEVNDCAF